MEEAVPVGGFFHCSLTSSFLWESLFIRYLLSTLVNDDTLIRVRFNPRKQKYYNVADKCDQKENPAKRPHMR